MAKCLIYPYEKNTNTMRNLITLLFALTCVLGYSQEFEVGVKGGVNLFHGDLVAEFADFESLGYGGGILARYHFDPRFDVRASANIGFYESTDLNYPNRAARGISSETTLIDFTIGAEWNLLGISIYQNQKRFNANFTPYLHIGVGGSIADATVTLTPEARPLDPLDANHDNPNFSMVVPLGVGVRYSLNRLVIGIEGTVTAGLNDYLDGVSKSGNSLDNDWYTSIGVTIAYRIGESASDYMGGDEEPVEYLEEDTDTYEEYEDDNN